MNNILIDGLVFRVDGTGSLYLFIHVDHDKFLCINFNTPERNESTLVQNSVYKSRVILDNIKSGAWVPVYNIKELSEQVMKLMEK